MRVLLFLIYLFSIACNSNIRKQANYENPPVISLKELFFQLPNEAFYIEAYRRSISKEERQIIMQSTTPEKAAVLSSNFVLDTIESSNSFLAFRSFANDDGVSVALKTWHRKDQSLIVGVIVSMGEHCCDYSKIKLFQYKNRRFKEVTEKLLPKLKVEDFAPNIDATTKALLAMSLQISIRAFPENDSLEVSSYRTPAMFDLYYSHDIEIELNDQELILAWTGNRFFIHAIRPLPY